MAVSKTGGAFGYLRKSIGGIVYSVSTASIKGDKKQVARSKPTSVRNPKTISQIVQRMKVVPAQKFYEAFEKAAGSVENNPLSHSFQGVPYGNKNKLRFMQLAMQGDPKAYVPKGVTFAAPGVYQVSEGSLPSLPSGTTVGDTELCVVGNALTQAEVNSFIALGAQAGDQITCMALIDDGGTYNAEVWRVILGAGNNWEPLNGASGAEELVLYDTGIDFDAGTVKPVACAAFILSRGTSSSTAKRSTAIMTIAPSYANLMSPEAYDAAIDSYITGVTYNSLNSDWYLNQGNTQAFNGEIFLLDMPYEGDNPGTAHYLIGRRLNGGNLQYVVFYYQVNQGAKQPWDVTNGNIAPSDIHTLAQVEQALGNVSFVEVAITLETAQAYVNQMNMQ